jgi:hypothetical protein
MLKEPNVKTETRTIKMSYDNFESAVVSWLYAVDAISDGEDVIRTDFGLPVDKDGMIEFDVEVNVLPRLELVK